MSLVTELRETMGDAALAPVSETVEAVVLDGESLPDAQLATLDTLSEGQRNFLASVALTVLSEELLEDFKT